MDLTPAIITAIVFITIYKIFELFVRRRERLMILDKISSENANFDLTKLCLPMSAPDSRYNALKIGALILGLGLGLFIYAMIRIAYSNCMEWDWQLTTTLCSSLVLLGGGLGLLMAFLIENFMRKSLEKNNAKK